MSSPASQEPKRRMDWDLKSILLVAFFLGVVGTFVGVAFKGAWPFLLARDYDGTVDEYLEFRNRGLFKSVKHRRVITAYFREVYVRDGISYGVFRCRLPDEIWNDPAKLQKIRDGRRPD